jgi:hypothetical protein
MMSLVPIELMRVMIDNCEVPFEKAYEAASRCFKYELDGELVDALKVTVYGKE